MNECASSPCGDHHDCVNEIGSFRCICSHGMTGLRCEIPPNYCTDNKCKNGATCQSDLLAYSCSCLPGYSGPFCEDVPGKTFIILYTIIWLSVCNFSILYYDVFRVRL